MEAMATLAGVKGDTRMIFSTVLWALFFGAAGVLLMVGSSVPWGTWEGSLIDTGKWTFKVVGVAALNHGLANLMYLVGFLLFYATFARLLGKDTAILALAVLAGLWEATGLLVALWSVAKVPIFNFVVVLTILGIIVSAVVSFVLFRRLAGLWGVE